MPTLDEIRMQIEELREQYLKEAKKLFGDGARAIFESHPKVQSFGWKQYTPYFNDGDACNFSVHADEYCIDLNGEDGDENVYRNRGGKAASFDDIDDAPGLSEEEHDKAAVDVSAFIEDFDDDMLRDLFGDRAHITVSRDGTISIDEANHE